MPNNMKVTFNNVRECEQAGLVGLIAYSPETGERENIPPTSDWGLLRCFPDAGIQDSKGNDFVIAMSATDVLVTEVADALLLEALVDDLIEDIMLDYIALDYLSKKGYF